MIANSFSIVSPDNTEGTKKAAECLMNVAQHYPHTSFAFAVMAKLSPTMLCTISLFATTAGLVLVAPERIPAWCALGAVIVTIFTVYYARKTDRDPLFLLIYSLASMFAGVASPRPYLHWRGVEAGSWLPEHYILLGAAFSMIGFTVLHTLYLLVSGDLPRVIRAIWAKAVAAIGGSAKIDPPQ